MSTINVTNLKGRGGSSPTLPDGAVVTGVITSTTFDGSLKTTGTPTLGLGVTINSSGINVSGVLTATTFKGDGSSLTGVGESIAPWNYNPDVNDSQVDVNTGIGITFNKKVVAGSGTATLKIVNAGVAGTTIQSWGVSSCTFNVTDITFGSLVSDLTTKKTYQLDIPEGFIVDSTGTNYAGTAYTFAAQDPVRKLWAIGDNSAGRLGQNQAPGTLAAASSPVQVPGITWVDYNFSTCRNGHVMTRRSDGTLWAWGDNSSGALGLQSTGDDRSSPAQIPGTTWAQAVPLTSNFTISSKTDGTLWFWGDNEFNGSGLNNDNPSNSPKQIGSGTDWRTTAGSISGGYRWSAAIKTDGTLWTLGSQNDYGQIGDNSRTMRSSATQIPGTTWNWLGGGTKQQSAVKTDGTLWMWGQNTNGQLGQNNTTHYSSPVQVPGTTWSKVAGGEAQTLATKTDGTAWAWGYNTDGQLGLNDTTQRSSPVQIPGTTWSQMGLGDNSAFGLKTDGTLWGIGRNTYGAFGNNETISRSSPIQIAGSETGYTSFLTTTYTLIASHLDETP